MKYIPKHAHFHSTNSLQCVLTQYSLRKRPPKERGGEEWSRGRGKEEVGVIV